MARLANALTDAGHDVGLWSADASPPTLKTKCRLLAGSLTDAMRDFGKPDFIHDNGLWRRHTHAIASLAKSLDVPRVVSTRGMLEPWARNHKKLKKRIAWQLYQLRDLARASRIHTTSACEAANVVSLRLGVPVEVIPNGVDIPALDAHSPREKKIAGCRRALVLGRYHPIKGLPMLVDAWARVRPPKWQLEIAGPDEA